MGIIQRIGRGAKAAFFGGGNLELFKLSVYIFVPVAIMYYVGTDARKKFGIPDFWPPPERLNRLPYEHNEIKAELERMRNDRLERRIKREKKLLELQEEEIQLLKQISDLEKESNV